MKPRSVENEDFGAPLPPKSPHRMMYVTPIEREMLLCWIERLYNCVAELSDALCDVEHDLSIDTRNLRVYARAANLEAVHINALGMRIEKEGHDCPKE